MAGGKETPRQKMIGMMYLFLTMMLALNVSSEVLKAFELIDQSLVKSAQNTHNKNELIHAGFAAAYEENKAKVEKWKNKADDVKLTAKALFDTIQNYKRTIVKIADQIPQDAWHDSLFMNIQKKDNMDVPAQVMILEGNGAVLKTKLNEFRDKMVSLIDDTVKYAETVKNVKANIVTADQIAVDGSPKPWENTFFENLPLAGVIANLSKIQSDIRNTESDMLAYLFGQIDAGSFKFNKLEAVVKAPSSYVLKGGKYEAEVFIAASDTTVKDEDLDIQVGGAKLPVKEGKGLYTASASSVGPKVARGKINFKGPDGNIRPYPFEINYEVGEPSLVVSPTKMNVFYIGVDNPVDISVSGVPEDKVIPFISGYGGTIRKSGGSYVVRVKSPTPKNKFVKVGANIDLDGVKKNMGSKNFRVKTVPDPVAKCGRDPKNSKGGIISKGNLTAQSGIYADLENFDFDLRFNVTGFTVSAVLSGGYEEVVKSTSTRFTPQQKALMNKVKRNGKVFIDDIVAVGPDKKPRKLQPLIFKVN